MGIEPVECLWEAKLPSSVISVSATPMLSLTVAACVDKRAYAFDSFGCQLWSADLEEEGWSCATTQDSLFSAFGTASKKPAKGTLHIVDHAGGSLAREPLGAPV